MSVPLVAPPRVVAKLKSLDRCKRGLQGPLFVLVTKNQVAFFLVRTRKNAKKVCATP